MDKSKSPPPKKIQIKSDEARLLIWPAIFVNDTKEVDKMAISAEPLFFPAAIVCPGVIGIDCRTPQTTP
jgi:hypothetical protein